MKEAEEHIKRTDELLNKKQYSAIIALLSNEILEKLNNPDLFFNRALAHDELEEFDQAIIYYSKAIEFNKKFFEAYYNRGLIWDRKGDPDKALEDYSKAIEFSKNDAGAYYNRGIIWNRKREYDKAIADYTAAIEIKNDDSSFYLNRGIVWYKKGEYDKAIADYTKALRLKRNNEKVYNNRGLAWRKKGEYDKALEDLNKALKLKPEYGLAYSNRGNIFYDKGEFSKSLSDYRRAMELDPTLVNLDYKIKLTEEKLEEIKILEKSKAEQKDKTRKVSLEKKIEAIIKTIREASLSEVKTVVHYTKVTVAEIYVKSNEAKMHYSNAIYMNDPMEGKVFFEYLSDPKIEEAYQNGEKRTETSVYLGSFLPAEENDGEISHEDELVMWRTYGKNEAGKEAAGCSVVLSSDFFKAKQLSTEDSPENAISEELLNVVYIKNQKHGKTVTNDPKGKIKPALEKLKEHLTGLIKLRDKYKLLKNDFYKDIENTIFKKLSTISYLFKSSDYNFEHEVRVITYMPRNSDLIKHRDVKEDNAPPKRFHIESNNIILPFVKKIYLGPKVEHHQQWSLYFDYEIRQRAKELELTPGSLHKIDPSEIEIVKSVCKFQ